MKKWLGKLTYNPISPLIECEDRSISLFAQRDLLDKTVLIQDLWHTPEAKRILRKQKLSGGWEYPGAKEKVRTQENYDQLETYRNLGFLIEKFEFNNKSLAVQKAAEYLLTFQTGEGDFRGIYGNQYTPNYCAGITELLIKAGYAEDTRMDKVFEWLISIRQEDGGWAIPFRTRNYDLGVISNKTETLSPDVSKPFSHMVTGVVLRAFAAHPTYRKSKEARQAGKQLLSSLFKKDSYPDRAGAQYWLRFSWPFWFTDLISALDTLSLLGFSQVEPQIDEALKWFIREQKPNGMWDLKILKGQNKDVLQQWLGLAICRIFKRLQYWRTPPKASDARLTKPEVRERMRNT